MKLREEVKDKKVFLGTIAYIDVRAANLKSKALKLQTVYQGWVSVGPLV